MHKRFDHAAIEKKWQAKWDEDGIYNAPERDNSKEKEYVLVELPYPSGNLHIGHWYAFGVPDIYVRLRRMQGKQVLFPMGFDAFGLPAENAAIKNNVNPREWTQSNIEYMRGQLASMGNAFTWDKTASTIDPDYYRWTQWMFTQFFENDIAYRGEGAVNWCPTDNTVIANEQVLADDTCERCGDTIEKKTMPQWMMRITDYADALADDLDDLDWPEHIKDAQRAWIGRSQGAEIDFTLNITRTKPKALILHGFAGDPEVGWKPWLKKELEAQGYEVRNPKLPNFDSPNYGEVMEFLREQTADFTDQDILIGHSLGGHFALKLAEEKAFRKVVCVAPSISLCDLPFDTWRKNLADYDIESGIKILEEHPINEGALQIVQKTLVFGETDGGIPISNQTKFGSDWNVITIPEMGHMSEETEVSEILRTVTDTVTIFTTRPDTLYGATYMVLAPEHTLVHGNKNAISNWEEVAAYIEEVKDKKEMDRLDATKEKTGVKLEGITATNPASGEEIPVYIADYVLGSYGTGAIMAVPAHDERDAAFAEKFSIQIKPVVAPDEISHCGALIPIQSKPGKYLMQRRELTKKVLPGKIGFFGGGVEPGESVTETLLRELEEELELKLGASDLQETLVVFSESTQTYCTVSIVPEVDPATLVMHEGEEMLEMTLSEIAEHSDTTGLAKRIATAIDASRIPYIDNGLLINSGQFDGMNSEEAKTAITAKVGGRMTNTYRLRDWSIGRQRYWGVPIPIVYDPEGRAHVVPAEHLPWTLPEDVDFKPTGEPPLAKSAELKKRTEDIFGAGWTPEVETMDTFVDSSWYFLRYIDPNNQDSLSSLDAQKDWMPIDLYMGGAEHTTMHLLYSRFWQKALHKLGLVAHNEPYKRRINRGLILGPDGNKMSKSKGNVIDPDEQVKNVGSDTIKMYLAFMGPYQGNNYPWDLGGLAGIHRFLERVNGLQAHICDHDGEDLAVTKLLHKTIQKVSTDIADFKFNTAISALMMFLNETEKKGLCLQSYDTFLRLLAPFAPHLTEELWHDSGNVDSVHLAEFPEFDPALAKDDQVTIGVQINGKVRGDITISPEATEEEALATAEATENIKEKLGSEPYKKVIYKPGRILNIIITP